MQIATGWMKEGLKQGRREGRSREGTEEGQLKAIQAGSSRSSKRALRGFLPH